MTSRAMIRTARHAGVAMLRTQSDERLIDLTRAGNDDAFEAIVERYRQPLHRYCARFLTSFRAEDVVQQTFLQAYRSITEHESNLDLRPWLYRIAHNSALNALRQAGWDHSELDERIDGVERPPQALERTDRFGAVVSAMQELPDRQREALVAREFEGRSYNEIAASLGVTDGAVRQLLNRARNTLRAGLSTITPPGFILRVTGGLPHGVQLSQRLPQVTAGFGGAGMAKVGIGLLAAGAFVGGGVHAGLPHHASKSRRSGAQTIAHTGSADSATVITAQTAKAPTSARRLNQAKSSPTIVHGVAALDGVGRRLSTDSSLLVDGGNRSRASERRAQPQPLVTMRAPAVALALERQGRGEQYASADRSNETSLMAPAEVREKDAHPPTRGPGGDSGSGGGDEQRHSSSDADPQAVSRGSGGAGSSSAEGSAPLGGHASGGPGGRSGSGSDRRDVSSRR